MAELTLDELNAIDPEDFENPALIRSLRETAGQKIAAKEAIAETQRENAFLKAGIDVESDLGQIAFRSFNGDVKNIEAIKAHWAILSPAGTPPTDPAAPVPDASAAPSPVATAPAETPPPVETGTAQRQALASDTTSATAFVGDPKEKLRDAAFDSLKKGSTHEAALADFVHGMVGNVMDGVEQPLPTSGVRPR